MKFKVVRKLDDELVKEIDFYGMSLGSIDRIKQSMYKKYPLEDFTLTEVKPDKKKRVYK